MIGALAGTIGAFIQDIYGYLVRIVGFTDRGFIDFARAVIFHDVKDGTAEFIMATMAHIIWDLLLGILFVHIINGMTNSYYYLKALIYGLFLWLPLFFHIPAWAAIITLIGAVIYSLGIAFIISILERK